MQPVNSGDPLLELEDSDLDFKRTELAGRLATASSRLATVRATRLDMRRDTPEDIRRYNQLSSEVEELGVAIKGLQQQIDIVDARHGELTVTSPIRGHVLTWDVDDVLELRPVRRGQKLLRVAAVDGEWVMELDVADDRIGHVLTAHQASQQPLDVRFRLRSDARESHPATVERIAVSTESKPGELASVLVTCRLEPGSTLDLRPGATTVAKIKCGRRSLGYVLFHELIDAIRVRLF